MKIAHAFALLLALGPAAAFAEEAAPEAPIPLPPPAVAPVEEKKLVTLTQAPKLPFAQRLYWGLVERENGTPSGASLARELYAKALDALGLRVVPSTQATPGPQEADFALLGTIDYFPEGADEGQKGARARLSLDLQNLGAGERLFAQTFEAYGAAKTFDEAKRAALERLNEPLGIALSTAILQALNRGIPIRFAVEGFSSREEQEDFELCMAAAPGFFDYHPLPATHDRLEFDVTIKGDSLNGFFAKSAATQGLGLSTATITPGRIAARYSLSRAFHLPGIVVGFENETPDSRALIDALESELRAQPGLFRLVFMPSRLSPPLPKARREFAAQYGSGLVLVPKLANGTLTLALQTDGGLSVAQVSGPADPAQMKALVRELLTALPVWLKTKGGVFKGLRARQYKVWRNEE